MGPFLAGPLHAKANQDYRFQGLGFHVLQQLVVDPRVDCFFGFGGGLEHRFALAQLVSCGSFFYMQMRT